MDKLLDLILIAFNEINVDFNITIST